MLKVTVILLFVSVLCSSHGRRLWDILLDKLEEDPVDYETSCKRQEDNICKNKTSADCDRPNVEAICPRLCGTCAPFVGVCPEEYKYGCCWNGDEARDFRKETCPECKDKSTSICNRPAIKQDCNLQSNSPETRRDCPVACGACHDFGN